MAWLDDLPLFNNEPVAVPYAAQSATSRQGAEVGRVKGGSQCAALLALYQTQGPQTDHQVEARLGWPIQRVCARRGALVKQGRVVKGDVVAGPFGAKNQAWRAK